MICRRRQCADERFHRRRASVLFAVMIVMVLAGFLCVATLRVSTSETKSAVAARQRMAALFVAESGIERVIAYIKDIQRKFSVKPGFDGIDALAGQTPFTAEPLVKDGAQVGQYTAQVLSVTVVDKLTRDISMLSTGFVPAADAPNAQQRRVTATVRLKLVRSSIFDYAYFMDRYGRLDDSSITVDGNARSNGILDCGTAKAKMQGVPRFEAVDGEDLQGYLDDNGDGIQGNDGGLYSSWDILADQVFGMGGITWSEGDAQAGRCDPEEVGQFANQHDFQPPIPMPNLTDLTLYEEIAKSKNSWIKIGETVVCGPVLGDDPGEKKHLYLKGTVENPIWINGPVVVRGSVIISGVVKGEGVIYTTGNVYVPENLTYETKPQPLPRPGSRNESDLENWLLHNKYDTDFLGLFAGGHVVIGDFTNNTWCNRVGARLEDPNNMTREDAGVDNVPGTKPGRDGILGTADDDVLEDDAEWTVERYTQEDADRGLIPAGFQVGDVIPGSGEDSDGDGIYDGPVTLSEFDLPLPLESANWTGNAPEGSTAYSTVATMEVYRLDGAFYSNHTFALATTARQEHFEVNGCMIGRNEAVYFDTKDLLLNYDYRLMAGDQFQFDMPKTWAPVRILLWQSN